MSYYGGVMSKVIKMCENVYILDVEILGLSNWLSTHLVIGDKGALLIDPGPVINVNELVNLLSTEFSDVRIRYIALTHIHLDHSGGLGKLVKLLDNVKVYVHPRGVKHLIDPSRLWEASKEVLGDLAYVFGPLEPIEPNNLAGLEDNSIIDLGGVTVRAIHTPGHASHHISYIIEPYNILVSGDALGNFFNGRIYPISVPPFNLVEYMKSIDKLLRSTYNYITVAHFGYVSDNTDIFIQRAKDKALAWALLIANMISSGVRDPGEVYKELVRRDLELNYMVTYRERHKLLEGSCYRAVLGMYQSVNELLSKYSSLEKALVLNN
jgi:glyoxylase-like metal-dependent hydrolase (beta-lactamase superfamily II)